MSTTPPATRPFDEQLWPIHAALAAWACVLAAVVVALGGFDDPRLLYNGWARLATIAATLAVLAWANSTVDAGQARRLKLAVVLSLLLHTLLVVALCRQRLEFRAETTAVEQIVAQAESPDAAPPQQFTLETAGSQPQREAFDRPVTTPAPAGQSLAVEHNASADTDSLRQPITVPDAQPLVAPRLLPLERGEQALAHRAATPAQRTSRPRQNAPPASAVADVSPDLDDVSHVTAQRQGSQNMQPRPAPEAQGRTTPPAAPRIEVDVLASVPELPAVVPTQDLPQQRPADPLPTIARDWGHAPTRRRVEAAPLPEMPSETRRLAQRTLARATQILDAQPTDPSHTPATPQLDSTARSGAPDATTTYSGAETAAGLARSLTSVIAGPPLPIGAADAQTAGRLSQSSLPRRRSSDAEPGLRSGGGLDRPLRSRGPTPAAPVMTPLPMLAATGSSADGAPRAAGDGEGDSNVAAARPSERAGPSSAPAARAEVAIDAPVGSGGLAAERADDAGLPDRLASARAGSIHLSPARLPNRHAGGATASNGITRQPAPAYAQRHARQQPVAGNPAEPASKTEAAIELGLEFLAQAQLDDGHWEFGHLGPDADADDPAPIIRADAAATGLALLSFLGAGYDHFDDRYAGVVARGLDYLVRSQASSGEIFPEAGQAVGQVTRFYGHGIAALALSEAYGMTGDPRLRRPAQAALDYLAATQNAQRGGWRYDPGTSADLSVTGWQMLALRSGELAGLRVRPRTYQGIYYLVENCRQDDEQQALFRYNPWASPNDPRTQHGLEPSTVMTSVGLLVELYLGNDRRDRRMQIGAEHLLANLPQVDDSADIAPTGTLGNPSRDTYYWYYATQVMFHMGGEYWSRWNAVLHPLLVDSQTLTGPLAGSWDPVRPQPDKWSAYGGRLYVTTLDLLSLEVTYRHLPLYNTAVPQVADRP